METRIVPIDLGFDTAYVLQADGCILIDAGQPRRVGVFDRALADAALSPEDITTIILTHAHWDHMGSAAAIRTLTGAELWVHRSESAWVRSGRPLLPPGVTPWGRTFMRVHKLLMPLIHVPPSEVDRELDDAPLRLDAVGIPGVLVHTPGHSPGSVSIILDSGEALVGDLAMNRLPICRAPSLPIFADDPGEVTLSWNRVLEHPVERVFPAHGESFGVAVIQKLLSDQRAIPTA